jgi:hypothetical protein
VLHVIVLHVKEIVNNMVLSGLEYKRNTYIIHPSSKSTKTPVDIPRNHFSTVLIDKAKPCGFGHAGSLQLVEAFLQDQKHYLA